MQAAHSVTRAEHTGYAS